MLHRDKDIVPIILDIDAAGINAIKVGCLRSASIPPVADILSGPLRPTILTIPRVRLGVRLEQSDTLFYGYHLGRTTVVLTHGDPRIYTAVDTAIVSALLGTERRYDGYASGTR